MQGMKSITTMIAELPPPGCGALTTYRRQCAEIELLKAAVEKRQLVGHDEETCRAHPMWTIPGECTCGYDDAQKALEAVGK